MEASHSLDSGRVFHHARSLETFCSQNGIRISVVNGISGTPKAVPGTTFPTPFASPLFTGSFPSSPLLYSPDVGPHRIGRIDLVPPLSLDGFLAKTAASPPESPPKPRQFSLHVRSLHEKLQNSPQVGIVHLALQNDTSGAILRSKRHPHLYSFPSCFIHKCGRTQPQVCAYVFCCSFYNVAGRMMCLWLLNLENLQKNL